MRIRFDFSSKKSGRRSKPDWTSDHRTSVPEMVKEVIRTSDVVLIVLDSRNIDGTRNKELEKEILKKGKKIVYVLNKIDLVDLKELKYNYNLDDLWPYVLFSSKQGKGKRKLRERVNIEVKKLKVKHAKARVGIIGYPNTGKSTLINSIAGAGKTKASSTAGFTKANSKIRFSKDIILIDTPGVIPDKEDSVLNQKDLKKHGKIGARSYDSVKDPDIILAEIMARNPGVLEKHYDLPVSGDIEVFLEDLAKKLNYLRPGGKVDFDRAARVVLKDIQSGDIRVKS